MAFSTEQKLAASKRLQGVLLAACSLPSSNDTIREIAKVLLLIEEISDILIAWIDSDLDQIRPPGSGVA